MCSLVRRGLTIRTPMAAALRHLTRGLLSSDTLMLHHKPRWCTQLDAELDMGSSNRSRRSGCGECTEAGREFIQQGPDPFSTCPKIPFAGGPAAMSPVHRAPRPDRPSKGLWGLIAPLPQPHPLPCLKKASLPPPPLPPHVMCEGLTLKCPWHFGSFSKAPLLHSARSVYSSFGQT